VLTIKPKNDCRWDLVSLGEVLLRFDPGDERIHNSRTFRVWEGGGEYNVARGLAKVFNLNTGVITALADNALGRLAEDLVKQGGVDTSEILWRETDGMSEKTRNGLYFIERGWGMRPPLSCFDRANTAISQLQPDDVDWNRMFEESGTRWFHTGGVFTGLSETTPKTAAAAMQAAKENGAIVSYDLNYRDSLWRTRGGRAAANEINKSLLPFVDLVFGVPGFDARLANFNENSFRSTAQNLQNEFPNLKIVASTLRNVTTADTHDLSAICYSNEQVFKAFDYKNVRVLDRVGSGDAFASGFIYGFLSGKNEQFAVDCGTAHATLAMTTPGDNSMAKLSEVLDLMQGGDHVAKR
jgi:2-dehydro-3-deoxygluconokinase